MMIIGRGGRWWGIRRRGRSARRRISSIRARGDKEGQAERHRQRREGEERERGSDEGRRGGEGGATPWFVLLLIPRHGK
jgi:hypothetical protein